MFAESVQGFLQKLATMQWNDYLDIFLVAYLLFRLIPTVRSSSMMRIVRTVLGVIILAAVTEALKLHTLNWLINQLLTVGLVALVVLFQPELRRMLDHLSNVKLQNFLGGSKPGQEMEGVIAQTIKACEVMSRERVGALIVFARDNRLEEYFKTGTVIDSQVSEQLIRNIFFPKAALHDGAMIVRDGRIAAGGHRLRGDRHHFRSCGRYAQAPSGTPDTGAAAAQRALPRGTRPGGESGAEAAAEAPEQGKGGPYR